MITKELSREVKDLARIMDTPNLVGLSYALRHPETWPEDFVWDYNNCKKCAMGLATELWKMNQPVVEKGESEGKLRSVKVTWIAKKMAIPFREARRIFWEMGPAKGVPQADINPDDIADAIDVYLKESA